LGAWVWAWTVLYLGCSWLMDCGTFTNIKDSSRVGRERVLGTSRVMYYDGIGLGHALDMGILGFFWFGVMVTGNI
jgi:hypothetical protein